MNKKKYLSPEFDVVQFRLTDSLMMVTSGETFIPDVGDDSDDDGLVGDLEQ